MTQQEKLDRWMLEYRRKLDWNVKIDALKRATQRLLDLRAKNRRSSEATSLDLLRWRVERAQVDAKAGKPFPIDLAQRWNHIHAEACGTTRAVEAHLVPVWRQHAEDLAREMGVKVEWVDTKGTNAYAWAKQKKVEAAPIISAFSYATVLHELGHVVRPCEPTHRPVVTDEAMTTTACARCELNAWQWAVERAKPTWARRMHHCLSGGLQSYRDRGTPAEQREIDELTSDLGFRRAQLDRIKRTA